MEGKTVVYTSSDPYYKGRKFTITKVVQRNPRMAGGQSLTLVDEYGNTFHGFSRSDFTE